MYKVPLSLDLLFLFIRTQPLWADYSRMAGQTSFPCDNSPINMNQNSELLDGNPITGSSLKIDSVSINELLLLS